jgi:hypothetical protein
LLPIETKANSKPSPASKKRPAIQANFMVSTLAGQTALKEIMNKIKTCSRSGITPEPPSQGYRDAPTG